MPDSNSFSQLVVVGSSAGGIEALSTLVSTLPTPPATFPAPIVIAQHLDPIRPSNLGEILARRSPLPVVTVQDHEHLKPGTVYVVPSNYHVQITDNDIRLLPLGPGRPKPSVDLLLNSAAEIYREHLIAVILTGTGSDGTAGARAVKQAGGTVMIQNPETAAYAGMPQSLDPQTVDIVADIERIGPILTDLLAGVAAPPKPDAVRELKPFLDHLRERLGADFRAYKPATIMRRLQRRIIATESGDLPGYVNYLESHPEEYQRLVSSFLIKVTEFFRDPELFDLLREQVLPELIAAGRSHDDELRIWSAGCATGEEAYSLAMLVCELLGDELPKFSVKIFATDLDAEAITFARRGLYSVRALAGLPDKFLARYFTKSNAGNGGYEVKKKLRGLVVFGEHDLTERPPFPRIDLVLCRNVLVYFSKELQQHALQLFAFALRDGGYLALGKTETVSSLAGFFTLEGKRLKIYRRKAGLRQPPPFPIEGITSTRERQPDPGKHRLVARELFQAQQEALRTRMSKEGLLQNLPIGVVLVDGRYDIQEINNAARRSLAIFGPAVGEDLVHLAQHVPHGALRTVIDRAIKNNATSSLDELPVPHLSEGEPSYLQITCYPQPGPEEGEPVALALVLITDITREVRARYELEQAHEAQIARSAELAQSAADLKVAIAGLAAKSEDLEQSNARLEQARLAAENITEQHARQVKRLTESTGVLVAANGELTNLNAELSTRYDEFLVTNEEAQAAIEEVETLNEEMQASNEELETLNEELQATIEELHTSNSDLAARGNELQNMMTSLEAQQKHIDRERARLEAILAGMADAVVVVTAEGKLLLSNAAYAQSFGDAEIVMVGESGIALPAGATPQARVARGETFTMTFSFTDADGNPHWYEAIGKPVRGDDQGPWGVVVIRDITERSLRVLQEQFMALANHELRTPLTTITGYLRMLATWLKNQPDSKRPLHNVTIALSQANRLTGLINDLLDVSRLQTGKFELQLAPVEFDTLLQQTVEVGQTLTEDQTIALAADTGDGPVVVNGDADRLQQMLLNLLTNAITYASGSKRIDVRLRRVGSVAELEVQDYGDGIEAEHLSNLFSRFFQVIEGTPSPGQGQGQGLGLGLFISHQIVAAHGGTISVESTVGEGTTFTVRLPLLEQVAESLDFVQLHV